MHGWYADNILAYQMTPSRLRQLIRAAEDERRQHVDAILSVLPPIRSASFVSVHRKCGKSTCHCATGQGHLTTYLSFKDKGKTRMIYVPEHLRDRIAREADGYRRLRRHRVALAKLAQRTLGLIDALQEGLETWEPVGEVNLSRRRGGAKRKQGRQ